MQPADRCMSMCQPHPTTIFGSMQPATIHSSWGCGACSTWLQLCTLRLALQDPCLYWMSYFAPVFLCCPSCRHFHCRLRPIFGCAAEPSLLLPTSTWAVGGNCEETPKWIFEQGNISERHLVHRQIIVIEAKQGILLSVHSCAYHKGKDLRLI